MQRALVADLFSTLQSVDAVSDLLANLAINMQIDLDDGKCNTERAAEVINNAKNGCLDSATRLDSLLKKLNVTPHV